MAGLYADVPGHRFAYDVDGTLVRSRNQSGQWQTLSAANTVLFNDEDEGDWMAWCTGGSWVGSSGVYLNVGDDRSVGTSYLSFIFPQLRNITGYFCRTEYGASNSPYAPSVLQVSSNTTDGSDGDWSTLLNPWTYSSSLIVPRMRDAIQPLTGADGVKGLRFAAAKGGAGVDGNDRTRMFAIHLYGTVVGSNNGIRFWNATLDQEMDKANFDFGDMPQSTVSTKTFRLKNTSAQTANSVVISAESNDTGTIAALASGMTFSTDNTSYAATATVTSLAPGATSGVLYARRTVGAAETQSARMARVKAVPGSWS